VSDLGVFPLVVQRLISETALEPFFCECDMPNPDFFGSDDGREAPAAPDAASSLPERMRGLHTRLIQVFQRAVEQHRRGHHDACVAQLAEFDRVLRAYLGNEEAELEDWMNVQLAGEAQVLLAMRQVRARLRQLARQVHEMLQPPHPSRLNPARAGGHEILFEGLLKQLVNSVDLSEMELLPRLRPGWSRAIPAPRPQQPAATEALPVVGSIWRKASYR
jgi:hypothetical protein